MQIDLNDTVAFIKVAEAGSFTAAAQELRTPKTTLSRRVRELEQRLGAQLLHRTTRRLSLTEAGVAYLQQCRHVPAALADAEAAVSQLQGQPRGTLRVTSSYSLMVTLVAPLLAEFRALYPEVRLDLVLSHRNLDLVGEQIDLALRMGPLADSTAVARRLAVLPNRIYASPGYLAQHGEPAHPFDLKRHLALVTRVARRGDGYAWPMTAGGVTESYEINPVIEADDPEVLKAALFAGAGLMMATDMIMQPHAAAGRVRPVLPGWRGRCPELHALFPGGRVQPPKLRVFVDFLVDHLNMDGAVPGAGDPSFQL
jgi:DNA-binding transcriptional LysR family regulator